MKEGRHDEKDISTKQFAAQKEARFSVAHVYKAGPRRPFAAACPRPKEAVRLEARTSCSAMETLKTRAEFQRVLKGRKWVTPAFILQGAPRNNDLQVPRFGFTVSSKAVARERAGSKKRGTAVDRNRARRRLKEAVRLTFPSNAKADFDYVIIGRSAAMARNFEDLLADMRLAFHKVG
jgi:ribonuclease P protein component